MKRSRRDLMMVKLDLIVRGLNKYKRITGPGEHPPCYKSQYQFDQWVKAAEKMDGAPPPVRKDWPREPNYCRDCSQSYRNRMRIENRCLFPDTVFVEIGEGEEKEIVGTSK